MDEVIYKVNDELSLDVFVSELQCSTLEQRRPIDDEACIAGMLQNANLIVTARIGAQCVGVARALSNFHYACYLSDLAVNRSYQGQGIGNSLIRLIKSQLGKRCKLILLSAPKAVSYYRKLGFKKHPETWFLEGEEKIAASMSTVDEP